MREKGLPSNPIKIIRMGQQGPTLKPKNSGILGRKVTNNGVSRGIPLSAHSFIIYDEIMMWGYENSLKPETIQSMSTIK